VFKWGMANMSNSLEDAKLFKKVDVSSERIARVYAESLFNAAVGEAESVGEELHDLVHVAFKKLPDLFAFFSSGTIATGTKKDLIEKHFLGKASDILVNFLKCSITTADSNCCLLSPAAIGNSLTRRTSGCRSSSPPPSLSMMASVKRSRNN